MSQQPLKASSEPVRPVHSGIYVVKRNGEQQTVSFDKITARIDQLVRLEPLLECDSGLVAQKVIQGVFPGVTTVQLDELAAETAAYMSTTHPDYSKLAARIAVSNLHKETSGDFVETMQTLHQYKSPKTNVPAPLVSDELVASALRFRDQIATDIRNERDYEYDYFAFKTLERSYLLKIDGKVCERPQQMLMRVALGIYPDNWQEARDVYSAMSRGLYTHATPTLFNSGTPNPQMSSCFLLTMKADSIDGIYSTLKDCALISKSAGGVGVNMSDIRATNSYIRGTNGNSNGLVPMLRVFNDTARYVDQGGGKRKGAFAIYLEPWHADVFEFLDLKKNHGKEEARARDLFYGLWIPDLFMKRVDADGDWALFCPNEAPGLAECWGDKFEELYNRYVAEGRARKIIKAQVLWRAIVDSQVETGTPYMLYKDACNSKSNQQNLGTIKGSNLCTEIIEFTSADEVAVCNLASISVSKFAADGEFRFTDLFNCARCVTRALNAVIDRNAYPVPEARASNMRHRPIGIGVQGLADAFIKLRMPFDSPEAKQLNRDIFETIYHGALWESAVLAERDGHYESYPGSPISKGILQHDMWNVKVGDERHNWTHLRQFIAKHGVRNSLLLAPMPTASTSQLLQNNEACEPYTSNLYTRRVLAGEFAVINRHLVADLIALNLWTAELRNEIVARKGSVQGITRIPVDLQKLYRTVWELKQRDLIDMAADRGAFICQSQSFNVHIPEPTYGKLTSMHFYGWRKGLKTGMYYLRTQAAVDAIAFTVDKATLQKTTTEEGCGEACSS